MIITWKPFDNLILTLILLNSLMIALTDYTVSACVCVDFANFGNDFFSQISSTGATYASGLLCACVSGELTLW